MDSAPHAGRRSFRGNDGDRCVLNDGDAEAIVGTGLNSRLWGNVTPAEAGVPGLRREDGFREILRGLSFR